jgi:hypothetical protein
MPNYRVKFDSDNRIISVELMTIKADIPVYYDKLAKGTNIYELKYF